MKPVTPNQRDRPVLDKDAWNVVVQWRPFVYRCLATFGSRAMKRPVSWKNEIGTPEFEWTMGGGLVYGVDPRSLMQDLEYRALEAAAEAATSFDEAHDTKFVTYLSKVIDNNLRDEFQSWLLSSAAVPHRPLDQAEDMEAPPFVPDEDDGLDESTRNALQEAMGALTAKEAWALRMHADGAPIDVIRQTLGHKRKTSTYALIDRAKTKAAEVVARRLPDVEVR